MIKYPAQIRSRTAPAANLAVCAAVFFSSACAFLNAAELPPPLTLDIPVPLNMATPAWLGHPNLPLDTLITLELPITPPDSHAALLMTVYFREVEDGFLRINWKPDKGTPVALASNFYENINMANSRSLLIAPSTLGAGGTLVLQGTAQSLGVQRIEFEWLESRQDLVSQKASAMLVTTSTGTTVPAESVNGQPEPAQTGTWSGDMVTVPIAADPVRIEQGVEFSVQLDKLPTTARLGLKESGLGLDQHIVVWVNQKRAGTITPTVPGLGDAGFFTDTASATNFVGWRDGSFYVPISALKAGDNTLAFSTETDATNIAVATADNAAPLALKDLAMQMNYAPPPGPPQVILPVLHFSAEPQPLPVSATFNNPTNP